MDNTLLLHCAYFCYTLLYKFNEAEALRTTAQDAMGVTIRTYGVNQLPYNVKEVVYAPHDEIKDCNSIGMLIRTLREQAGLTLHKLAKGICSPANLGKIELDDIQGKMQYVVPLLQRLGRDAHIYCPFHLRKEDFLNVQMQDNIHMLQTRGDYEKSTQLLEKLRDKKAYQSRANLQFIKRVEALNFNRKNPEAKDEYISMLLEALHITCPQYNERDIDRYPLTHDEIILINSLACYYTNTKEYIRSANMFESLLYNLQNAYVDKSEKSKMYGTVIYNYTRCLGRMGQREEALKIIEDGLEFDREWGCLFGLSELTFNKAYNIYMLEDNEKSVPYFMQAYYGITALVKYGFVEHQQIAKNFMKEHLNIIFD